MANRNNRPASQQSGTPDVQALMRQLLDSVDNSYRRPAVGGSAGVSLGGISGLYRYADPRPKLLRKRRTRARYVVRVDLDGARPPIWRRLALASDMTLDALHDVLQTTMGWEDAHLHHFLMGPDAKDHRMTPFLNDDNVDGGETGIYEGDVQLDQVLAEPGHRLYYEYDFGDSWRHTIKLEKVELWTDGVPDAVCLTGRRACPPEDCGGLWGYAEILDALDGDLGDDPEWTQERLDWLPEDFDPAEFDAAEINRHLAHRYA